MSSFTTPIALIDIANENLDIRWMDKNTWQLLVGFDFASQVVERIIKVPAGFNTDFASIPKLFQNILSPTGPYAKAALTHDYLYRTKGQATKEEADSVFLEAMEALKVNRFVRTIMYRAVKYFGGGAYQGSSFVKINV